MASKEASTNYHYQNGREHFSRAASNQQQKAAREVLQLPPLQSANSFHEFIVKNGNGNGKNAEHHTPTIEAVRERTQDADHPTSIVQEPLFGQPREIVGGAHNVHDLVSIPPTHKDYQKIKNHYIAGGRGAGHIPDGGQRFFVIPERAASTVEPLTEQIEYLNSITSNNRRIDGIVTYDELTHLAIVHQPLVVPYATLPNIENELTQNGTRNVEVWGLPGKLNLALKNKVELSLFAQNHGQEIEGLQVPDFQIAKLDNIAKTGNQFLEQNVKGLYKSVNMPEYPVGLVIRGAIGDGGYGSCVLKEEKEGIVVLINGEAALQPFTNWNSALSFAQNALIACSDPERDDRVVINRFIDFLDSPGISGVFMKGQFEHFGWNGQIQAKDSGACIGTSTYQPQGTYLETYQQAYEEQSAQILQAIVAKVAEQKGINVTTIRGVANADFMIPGRLERKLQRRRKQKVGGLYLAEINSRFTNFTEALLYAAEINGKAKNIAAMREIQQEGIVAKDKHPYPSSVTPKEARKIVKQVSEQMQESGIGAVYVRMANEGNPLGLVVTGKQPELIFQAIDKEMNKYKHRKETR